MLKQHWNQLACAAVLSVIAMHCARAVEPGLPSRTAIGAAVGRAIGAKNPNPEFRNPDYLAINLLGPRERSLITDFPAEILDLDFDAAMKRYPNPTFVTAMFVRTRFFDRILTEALERKFAQVVVLGAGLDSRGYRFEDQLRGVKFFEVDSGPTQDYKKRRVTEIFGHLPQQVRYVLMDFTKDDLLTELRESGYSEDQTTLFIWEAVTFYLPESAVKSTLDFVRDHAGPGSTIAFDYTLSRNPDVGNPNSVYARMGEPWLFGFPDSGPAGFVRAEGLEIVGEPKGFGPDSPEGKLLRSTGSNLPPIDSQRVAVMGVCVARTPERTGK